jgi:hypothetical protein
MRDSLAIAVRCGSLFRSSDQAFGFLYLLNTCLNANEDRSSPYESPPLTFATWRLTGRLKHDGKIFAINDAT